MIGDKKMKQIKILEIDFDEDYTDFENRVNKTIQELNAEIIDIKPITYICGYDNDIHSEINIIIIYEKNLKF